MQDLRIGVCARPDQIAAAAAAGFDYVELDLGDVLAMDESAYRAMADEMARGGVYAEVVCNLLSADVPVVGAQVSAQRLHRALDRAFEAARALGASVAVFDCAPARRLAADFDPAMAWRQLGNFIRILQSYAADFDLRVALMPLRRSEADLMNYVSEATLISAMLRLDRVGVAASGYNMAMEAESHAALRRAGSLLWHMRVSNALGNRLPAPDDGEDYAGLIGALRVMNYEGRLSCEGAGDDLSAACARLRAALAPL